MRCRSTSIVALAIVALAASEARAQDPVPLEGVPVVVELRGERRHGADRLSRKLRRTLADSLGGLRSSRALHREQDRLEVPRKERTRPSQLSAAARGIGADYIVFVRVVRKKYRRFVAKGYLIDAKSEEILHKHVVKYQRPSRHAAKAGLEIADEMLSTLREIRRPPPPPPEPPPPPPPPEPPVTAAVPTPILEPPPPAAPPPTIEKPEPLPTRRDGPRFRFGLRGGSGLVRSYRLTGDTTGASDLSHSLSPLALVGLSAEGVFPSFRTGITLDATFRPVGYSVVTDGQTNEPGGFLLDGRLGLNYRLEVAQREAGPVELLPGFGVRLARASVDDHPGNVVLAATLVSIYGGFGVRIPYDDKLEFDAGVGLGAIASYSESPGASGESPGGFTFGADLGLRYWFSDLIGAGFDTRFDLDRVSFSGAPTRALTRDEQVGLTDATLTMTDVRTSVSVLVRL